MVVSRKPVPKTKARSNIVSRRQWSFWPQYLNMKTMHPSLRQLMIKHLQFKLQASHLKSRKLLTLQMIRPRTKTYFRVQRVSDQMTSIKALKATNRRAPLVRLKWVRNLRIKIRSQNNQKYLHIWKIMRNCRLIKIWRSWCQRVRMGRENRFSRLQRWTCSLLSLNVGNLSPNLSIQCTSKLNTKEKSVLELKSSMTKFLTE